MADVPEILHNIHVKLYPNYLPDIEGKYIARSVRAEAALAVRQVCASALNRGKFTGNYEDFIRFVDIYLEECVHLLMDGFAVENPFYSIRPTVSHTFNSPDEKVDGIDHCISLSFRMLEELIKLIEQITVTVDGIAETDAYISEVFDVISKKKNNTITPGGMVVVTGRNFKVGGEEDQPSIGVYLDDIHGDHSQIEAEALSENTAGKIILQVPNLGVGVYHLRIVTQCSHGGTFLKEPRTIYFDANLTVI